MIEWKKIEGKLFGINLPSEIDFYIENKMNKLRIHINHPELHMYENGAAFEAWALLLHSKMGFETILSFTQVKWDGSFYKLDCQQANYMRFLYRTWKFSEQFSWFCVDNNSIEVIKAFQAKFAELKGYKKLLNNVPKQDAAISDSNNSKLVKTEHYFENAFVIDAGANSYLKELVKNHGAATETNINELYHQLPVGLFEGSRQKDIQENNRIFPTGFVDIWGISTKNELCLFELKVADTSGKSVDFRPAGIISELFFYANFSKDIFMDKNHNGRARKHYRGYDKLLTSSNEGITKVKAYFLANQFHARIEDDIDFIVNCLNANQNRIEYKFLKYDYDLIKPCAQKIQEDNSWSEI